MQIISKPNFILTQHLKKSLFSLLLFFIVTGFTSVYAQNVQLEGQILDSINQPVANTNLIATPYAEGEITFAIADDKGKYDLKLNKDLAYKIEITSL